MTPCYPQRADNTAVFSYVACYVNSCNSPFHMCFKEMSLLSDPIRNAIERFQQNFTLTSPDDLLKPTGYVMHHQFNIQQLYALPTLYLCVLYLSHNKERLAPLTA